jgi:hypothetical protein
MTSTSLLYHSRFSAAVPCWAYSFCRGGGGLRRHVLVIAVEVVGGAQRAHELQALGPDGLGVDRQQVEIGPGLDGVPLVHLAVPHRVAVVVLGDRPGEPGPGGLEQRRPRVGIPVAAGRGQLGLELGELAGLVIGAEHEVVVRPHRRLPVGGDVVLVLGRAAVVHVAGVPLVAERGDAEHAPVVVDAELGVLEPGRRRRVLVDRRPTRGVALRAAVGLGGAAPQQAGRRGGPGDPGGDEQPATADR